MIYLFDMEKEIYILKNRSSLNIVYFKIKNSLEDIIKNNPQRRDLIESMTDSQICVGESLNCLIWMEKELRMMSSRNFDLELINLKLISEIKELKKINDELINRVVL